MAKQAGLTQQQARLALEALVDILQDAFLQGLRVELRNFGVFRAVPKQGGKATRIWTHPKTGERRLYKVTGGTVKFKPSLGLLKALAGFEPKPLGSRSKKLNDIIAGLIEAEH